MILSARMSRGSATRRRTCASRSLRLQIFQERNPHSAEGPSLERGQDEERQPGDQGNDDDAPVEEIERRPRQAGSQEELVERTAQDERELFGVGPLRRDLSLGRCSYSSVLSYFARLPGLFPLEARRVRP